MTDAELAVPDGIPAAPVETSHAAEVGNVEEAREHGIIGEANARWRQFSAYAGPRRWGPWVTVGQHGGVVTYVIKYSAVGSTVVHGTVRYYSDSGWRSVYFRDSITITTGYAWATVEVCFCGDPLGSAVNGLIAP